MKILIFIAIILAVHAADIETQNTLDASQSVVETKLAFIESTTDTQTVDIADCEWQCYRDRYPDLQDHFGNDMNAIKHHYIEYGASEERDCTCHFTWQTEAQPYCKANDPIYSERNMYNLRKNPNYKTAWRDQGWIEKALEGASFSCHGQLIYGAELARCQGQSILVSGDNLKCGGALMAGQDSCPGMKKACFCQQQSRFVKKDPYCEDLSWSFAANEQEKFSCFGMVRYGAPSNWRIVDSRARNSHQCNGASFGDPFENVVKTCECATWRQRASEIVQIEGFWKNLLVCSPTAYDYCMAEIWESTATTTGSEVSTSDSSEYSVSTGVKVGYKGVVVEAELSIEFGYTTASETIETISNELTKENGNQITVKCAPGTWMYTWNYFLSGSDGSDFVQSTNNFQCNPPTTPPQCHPKLCMNDLCTQCRDD